MTNEEREKKTRIANMLIGAINNLKTPMLMYQVEKDVAKEALENYIKALEQQPCEDCISRADVKKYLSAPDANGDRVIYESDLDLLPPVTPKAKTGWWIEVFVETPNDPYSYGFKSHKCSKCECRSLQISNYCPNCGAKMVELQGSEE